MVASSRTLSPMQLTIAQAPDGIAQALER